MLLRLLALTSLLQALRGDDASDEPGVLALVEQHLRDGVDPNSSSEWDSWGRGPLYNAAHKGFVQVGVVLVAAGADLDATDSAGVTPLIQAAYRGRVAMVELLLLSGARTEPADKDGRALDSARLMQETDESGAIVQMLLAVGQWQSKGGTVLGKEGLMEAMAAYTTEEEEEGSTE